MTFAKTKKKGKQAAREGRIFIDGNPSSRGSLPLTRLTQCYCYASVCGTNRHGPVSSFLNAYYLPEVAFPLLIPSNAPELTSFSIFNN
jgi:hypothetical protein